MKLYTEEQIMQCYNMGVNDGSYGRLREDIEDLDLTPIELPSDEEIENEVNYNVHIHNDEDFINGAKWFKEQLKK